MKNIYPCCQATWLEVLKHTYAYISNTKERDGMDGLCYLIEVIPHQFTSIATKTILGITSIEKKNAQFPRYFGICCNLFFRCSF